METVFEVNHVNSVKLSKLDLYKCMLVFLKDHNFKYKFTLFIILFI